MPPKSRRKKKYAGQRRPMTAANSPASPTSTAAPQTAVPVAPREPTIRAKPVAARSPGAVPLAPTNLGREVRTIAVLAAAAVVVIVALSFALR